MRNNSKFVFAAFASTLLVLSACNQGPVRTLTGIEVTEEPVKVSYDYGEEFDARGLVISSVYSDETKEILPSTEYTLAGYDAFAPGEQEITVTYQPDKDNAEQVFTASFNVTVAEAGIASIYIYAKPTKLEYERNESFDPAGLVVLAIYEDDSYDQIPSALLSLSKPDMSTSGKKTVTVTYGSFTESFEINVKVPTIKKLVVEVYPEKTIYNLNENFSTKGLKVSYLMSDKSYDEVLNYDISYEEGVTPQNITSSYGVKKVNISVGQGEDKLETSFSISVIQPVTYTYNDYLTVSPSNWNELTYQDNNDTEIMSRIGGSFFTFNYAFEEGHEGDLDYIIDGGYQVQYDAVSKLEDVTADYAGDEHYAVPEDATKNYAYKFTLREDLKWDDGTPIKAEDFVYTMKEQENPDFFNYRADSFYNGDTIIHKAKDYLYQGSEGYFNARSSYEHYDEANDADLYFRSYAVAGYPDDSTDPMKDGDNSAIIDWELGSSPDELSYFKPGSYGVFILMYLYQATDRTPTELAAMSKAMDGKTLAEIKANATLNGYWEEILGFWKTQPDEELDLLVKHIVMPAVDFKEVGIFVGEEDNELIVVLDKELALFKEDGKTLSYRAAYNFSSLPLVKKDLYEDNKVEPATETGYWTSTYNSSVESTASWGPYKLTYFQAGKQFILDRNPNWYGYNMPEYAGQYQTDRLIVDTIAQWNTAWLAFRQGDLAGIGIDVSVSADYKGSERAIYTASDFVSSMQLQSNKDELKKRETEGVNKSILAYADFRAAISLGFDRAEYTKTCTTASLPGFGIFNSMHYYDVENGGVYRNTDQAKKVICEVYGVDPDDYPGGLDEAYEAVTGLNMELAKQKVDAAYDAALAAGDIKATDNVVLTVGAAEDTEAVRRQFDFIKKSLEELAKGTKLEGRLTAELNTSFGSKWSNSFRAGEYDICTGGWTGAAWNPGYFLLAYLSPSYMYSKAWDTSAVKLTYNPYGDGEEDHTYTMSLLEWYDCLNSATDARFKWGIGGKDLPEEGATDFRLGIIAQLERQILLAYYTVPIAYAFTASLVSYKIEQGSRTYNTFMGYGGLRYITYNYTDAAWEPIKGTFDYKN